MVRAMPAPKEYPKGAAQFDPKWYLMHETESLYIGPFDDEEAARAYKEIWEIFRFHVVRTSKPHKATSPRGYMVNELLQESD